MFCVTDVDGTLTAARKVCVAPLDLSQRVGLYFSRVSWLLLQVVTPDMLEFLKKLRESVTVGEFCLPRTSRGFCVAFLVGRMCTILIHFTGVVGGSDLPKAQEQLGENFLDIVDWGFPENGLNAFKDGKALEVQSLKKHLVQTSSSVCSFTCPVLTSRGFVPG